MRNRATSLPLLIRAYPTPTDTLQCVGVRAPQKFGNACEAVAALRAACLVVPLLLFTNMRAVADDFQWVGGVGPWTSGANWLDTSNPTNAALPTLSDSVYIGNGGSPQVFLRAANAGNLVLANGSALGISSGSLNVIGYNEFIGYSGVGRISQTGGNNNSVGTFDGVSPFILGFLAGSTGTYHLTGGTINATSVDPNYSEVVGWAGTGTFTQNGGTNNVKRLLIGCAGAITGFGNYILTKGLLNVTNEETYGGNDHYASSFTQVGGEHRIGSSLYLACDRNGTNSVSLIGAGSLTVASVEYIGYGSCGLFLHSAGVNSASSIQIGHASGAYGSYTLTNVGYVSTAYISVGFQGTGLFTQHGGEASIGNSLLIGESTGTGAVILADGILSVANEFVGYDGGGTFDQNGGRHTVTNVLTIAANPGSTGYFGFRGGSLSVGSLRINPSGSFVGNGTITGAVHNSGTLSPGVPLGNLTISSQFSQAQSGSLNIEIGGPLAGEQFDQLLVGGAASLNGALNIAMTNSFAPRPGDRFTILSCGSRTGTFSLVSGTNLGGGLFLIPSYGSTNVALLALQPTLSGLVSSMSGNSIVSNATIRVDNTYVEHSGADGVFTMTNISPGEHTVVVECTNYYTLSETVVVSPASFVTTHDFLLRPNTLNYFGVGVNWGKVSNPQVQNVLGGVDANNLYQQLTNSFPTLFGTGVVVNLDASESVQQNLAAVSLRFSEFISNVYSNDTVVFYVSSHGDIRPTGLPIIQLDVSIDVSDGMTDDYIIRLLRMLPKSVRKIAFFDACHSAGVLYSLPTALSNFAGIAAAKAYLGNTSALSAPDGTGIFTRALIKDIDAGVYDVSRLCDDIEKDRLGLFPEFRGLSLALRDSGYAVFDGLEPQLYEGGVCSGSLAAVAQAPSTATPRLLISSSREGRFELTVVEAPRGWDVAIEVTTNLTSWLQVAFYPVVGQSVSYASMAGNGTAYFFRAKCVP